MSAPVDCGTNFALDSRQQGVFEALLEKHADLASMYRAALRILASGVDEGDRRMRVAHICHAMREVMNRFADAMGANSSERIKPTSGVQIQALPDLLARHPDLVLDQTDQDLVAVPQQVAAAFDKLIKTAVQEKIRSRDIAATLLTDDGNARHPAVGQWMNTRDEFVRWAHLEAKPSDPNTLPSDEDLLVLIRVVEDLIEGVTKLFFDARQAVDDLLNEINETEGDES
jgi:hypothetical protein